MVLICGHIRMELLRRNASIPGFQYMLKESQVVKNNMDPSLCSATLNPMKQLTR